MTCERVRLLQADHHQRVTQAIEDVRCQRVQLAGHGVSMKVGDHVSELVVDSALGEVGLMTSVLELRRHFFELLALDLGEQRPAVGCRDDVVERSPRPQVPLARAVELALLVERLALAQEQRHPPVRVVDPRPREGRIVTRAHQALHPVVAPTGVDEGLAVVVIGAVELGDAVLGKRVEHVQELALRVADGRDLGQADDVLRLPVVVVGAPVLAEEPPHERAAVEGEQDHPARDPQRRLRSHAVTHVSSGASSAIALVFVPGEDPGHRLADREHERVERDRALQDAVIDRAPTRGHLLDAMADGPGAVVLDDVREPVRFGGGHEHAGGDVPAGLEVRVP